MAKREAIRDCKRFWKAVEKSGLSKDEFLLTPEGKVWEAKDYMNTCPLCEYGTGKEDDCGKCPLKTQYGKDCYELGYVFVVRCPPRWFKAIKGLKE
ncbi:hypothetical protein LCGC14_0365970 [marine sediment metagenome]|uniref:Uncharacterized protein n=1 Tax=marine sediment metagenome TaxID=412755 RepID=A0A0F9T6V3_9ZZZZ